MIKRNLLAHYQVEEVSFSKGDYIFKEGAYPRYYYQIIKGGIKMCFLNSNGNEFIQGIFGKNKSFGEPPLLIDVKYPANAIALSDTQLLRLTKENFKQMLLEHPEVHYEFSKMLSQRVYYKAVMANGMTSNSAEQVILTLLNYLKQNVFEVQEPFALKIELTRKNIAGLSGLSIESTIRTIKKMEARGMIKLINKKIYI